MNALVHLLHSLLVNYARKVEVMVGVALLLGDLLILVLVLHVLAFSGLVISVST